MRVVDLIQARLRGEKDDFHLALSVEGGMMRGAISAGMIETLHSFGAKEIIDSIWGTSIGSLNAAYFAADDTAGRSELYAQAAEGGLYRSKIDPVHGWIDLHWLFDTGFDQLQPLPFDRLPGSSLRFLVTRAGWGEAREAVSLFRPEEASHYRELLQAACRAPLAAGFPIKELRGGLWDAAPYENWPMKTPLASGATHLLVLRTTPKDVPRKKTEKLWIKSSNWFFCTPSYLHQETELNILEKEGLALAIYPRKQIVALRERDPDLLRMASQEGRESAKLFWGELAGGL